MPASQGDNTPSKRVNEASIASAGATLSVYTYDESFTLTSEQMLEIMSLKLERMKAWWGVEDSKAKSRELRRLYGYPEE